MTTNSERTRKAHATRRTNRLAADRRRAEAAGFNARGEQDWVPVEALFSDARYQRDVDPVRVARMAAEFDPDALGVITVSERANGKFAVLDGFHRVEVMRYLGWHDQKMPAFVYSGLTVAEEAEIFTRTNRDRRALTRLNLFKAQVTARDADAVALDNIMRRFNLKAANKAGPRNLRSLATADKIIKIAGEQVLETTLQVMLDAWSEADDALNGDLLSGIGLLIFSNTKVDPKRLATQLGNHTPAMVLNKAKMMKDLNPELTPPACVANVVTTIYNTRLHSYRLAAFPYRGWPKRTLTGVLYGLGWNEKDGDGDVSDE